MDIVSDGSGNNTAYVLTGKTLHTVDLATGTPTTLARSPVWQTGLSISL